MDPKTVSLVIVAWVCLQVPPPPLAAAPGPGEGARGPARVEESEGPGQTTLELTRTRISSTLSSASVLGGSGAGYEVRGGVAAPESTGPMRSGVSGLEIWGGLRAFFASPEPPFFVDGFESGDLTRWDGHRGSTENP